VRSHLLVLWPGPGDRTRLDRGGRCSGDSDMEVAPAAHFGARADGRRHQGTGRSGLGNGIRHSTGVEGPTSCETGGI
jgi:hypothetical protein